MKENENIIAKIKKLLALAANNPSEEEAKSAALKAQELLAQYHIDMKQVENLDLDRVEEIEESFVEVPSKKWKYRLAIIVAKNFRCAVHILGVNLIVFFGHKTDVAVAAETFKYLFRLGDKFANRAVKHAKAARRPYNGLYNTFVLGFCAGLEQAFAEQSTALMVVVPEDVTTAHREMMMGCKTVHRSMSMQHNTDVYEQGKAEGYKAMQQRRVTA